MYLYTYICTHVCVCIYVVPPTMVSQFCGVLTGAGVCRDRHGPSTLAEALHKYPLVQYPGELKVNLWERTGIIRD